MKIIPLSCTPKNVYDGKLYVYFTKTYTHTHTHSLVSAAHSKGVPKFSELAGECASGQYGGANSPGLVSKAGGPLLGQVYHSLDYKSILQNLDQTQN